MSFAKVQKLERSLASLLHYGTLFASLLMTAGVLSATASFASLLTTAGVGLLILLPVFRVLLMAFLCAVAGEYRFAWIAAVVLMIVAISCAVGLKLGVASA